MIQSAAWLFVDSLSLHGVYSATQQGIEVAGFVTT